MATNRASRISKLHKTLKKHYKTIAPPTDRSLFEHLLFACCLEEAPYDKAEQAFATLQESFFDWNERRVTTVTELTEVMSVLPKPGQAAANLKRVLHNLFETHYDFDIEHLKKENLGKATDIIENKYQAPSFVVAYATQAGLGGHAIPVDANSINVLHTVGVITDAEAQAGQTPGLERAISKSKGVEFASMLHQLAADLAATPFSNRVRSILTSVDGEAKDRLPKRSDGKKSESAPKKTAKKKTTKKKPAAKKTAAKKPTTKKTTSRKTTAKKKSATKRLTKKKPR